MFRLLSTFARAPQDEREVVASEWLGRPTDPNSLNAVEAGLAYIFENLTDDIRLSTAARLAYMSEPTFSKYFRSATGMTFSSMVKKLRIAHARRLLDTTDRLDRPGGRAQRLPQHGQLQPPVPGRGGRDPHGLPQARVVPEAPAEVFSLGLRAWTGTNVHI